MKTSAASQTVDVSGDASGNASGGLAAAWTRFWFQPVPATGMHWLRFGAGLIFLLWLAPLTAERHALFGLDGYLDRTGYVEASRLRPETLPPINWSLLYVFGQSPALLDFFWWTSLAVLTLFTLGIATRLTAVLSWLIVVSFLASPTSLADADFVLVLPAFYLMLGYLALGQWSWSLSPLERLLGPKGTALFSMLRRKDDEPAPSYAANITVRLLQVHFAIVVVASALHKLQVDHWWAGVAYWFPLHPPLEMDADRLQAAKVDGNAMLFVLTLIGYLVLAWQFTFRVFAWRRRLRPLLLGGGLVGALGCIFVLGEPTFGPLFALFCLSYLTPAEWRWLTDRVAALVERRTAEAAAEPAERKGRLKTSTAVRP